MSAQPLTDASVTELVREATAAPSLHNAQPWRFVYRTTERLFEVHHDPERAMPHLDPDGRAQHLGCGAALFNLRVALAHAGWETATTLVPSPLDAHLLATVRALDPAPAPGDLAALHPAIGRRRSSRSPFSAEAVPEDVRAGLREAARAEGARLLFPDAWHVETVLELVRDAEGREAPYAADPGAADETARWTRVEGARAGVEGVPPYAFGPRKYDGRAPVRDFAGQREVPGRGAATFEAAPQLALLGTESDRPVDWLRAGQALERVLLRATLDGLATSLTSHPLEWSDLRWAARDPLSAMGQVHMVLRLGYGPTGPSTPRRPMAEVLAIVP
ncbi:nitroreductase [Streptomyces sp. 71268]|uniref:Acg family FMN-binding oxidoreductase n=1 Tax=Streptomyces sp. 71268 TaxID=3002640 RepID=UPI0023F72B11|nr:nitroreductase family protein [Streptomyces sp. 71268]WEV24934.1 nitroreductase [Streptomyces sp. 71268]